MTTDENILAGWAHFPIFLWIIGPLLVWPAVKSDYAKYQVKQAFVWQLIWCVVVSISFFVSYVGYVFNHAWGAVFQFLTYLLATIAIAYSIYGAYKTFEGEEFSYPLLHYHIKR